MRSSTAWQLARERGLSQLTLRDIAHRVGMRPPSLYSHFESKNAIYDAMFAAAWSECLVVMSAAEASAPASPRAAIGHIARAFFDFSASDLSRHQLMNQRTIFGFEPSAESYVPAVATLEVLRAALAAERDQAGRHRPLRCGHQRLDRRPACQRSRRGSLEPAAGPGH